MLSTLVSECELFNENLRDLAQFLVENGGTLDQSVVEHRHTTLPCIDLSRFLKDKMNSRRAKESEVQ